MFALVIVLLSALLLPWAAAANGSIPGDLQDEIRASIRPVETPLPDPSDDGAQAILDAYEVVRGEMDPQPDEVIYFSQTLLEKEAQEDVVQSVVFMISGPFREELYLALPLVVVDDNANDNTSFAFGGSINIDPPQISAAAGKPYSMSQSYRSEKFVDIVTFGAGVVQSIARFDDAAGRYEVEDVAD